jgi:hypothetical protein
MKKLILTLLLATATTFTFAQYHNGTESQWSYTIIGGGSLAYFQVKSTTSPVSVSPRAVASAGFSVNYNVNDYFSISPALMLSGKGGQVDRRWEDGSGNLSSTLQYDLYYLQGSLSFTGHLPVGEQANIFLGAGPYYASGLWGHSRTDYTDKGQGVHYGSNGDFKSNDYGITSLAGFQFESGFIIGLNFDLGLFNINQPNSNDVKTNDQFKNRCLYVSFGKSF